MGVKTKAELKSYFETGDTPTQENFEDLIDSLTTVSQIENEVLVSIPDSDIDTLS